MIAIIDQDLCAKCSSCFSNCQYEAITRRGDGFYVSTLCTGCGNCIQFCPTKAMGNTGEKIEFDNVKVANALEEKLGLTKQIVAMKYANKPPEGVEVEEGPQFWCAMCGDVYNGDAEPLFFTAESSMCGGSQMVGVGSRKVEKEVMHEALIGARVIGEGCHYETVEVMSRARDAFPPLQRKNKGVIIGSLKQIKMPDLILFVVNARQLCMTSTAYAFDSGNIIQGFAGSAGCIMAVSYPLAKNRPVFTCGDHGARMFGQLDDNELIMGFPYRLVPGLIKNLGRTHFAGEQEE